MQNRGEQQNVDGPEKSIGAFILMTAPKMASSRPEFSPLSLIRAFWKHKFVAICVMVVVSVGVAIFVHHLPALYRAQALILVDSQKIPERYVASTVNTDVQDRLATISQQILSATRLKKIIDDFGLYREERKTHVEEEILEFMRKDVEIQLERGWTNNRPGAFRISYKGPDPATVAEVANRIANLFIEENLRTREVQAEGTSEFIGTQLTDAKKKLDDLESAVSKYKLQHNGELPEQEQALSGTLARLQVELQGNQDALNRAQQSKVILDSALSLAEAALATITQRNTAAPGPASKQLEAEGGAPSSSAQKSAAAGGPKADPKVSIIPEGDSTRVLIQAGDGKIPSAPQRKSELLEQQLEALRIRYGDSHPDVKRLRQEIAQMKEIEKKDEQKEASTHGAGGSDGSRKDIQKQLAAITERAAQQEIERAQDRITQLKAQMKLVGQDIDNRTNDRQRILKDIATYQKRIEFLPVREQEMAGLLRDYEISKETYRSLLEKRSAAEMATDMERRQKAERFTMLDPARVPEKPFSPNRDLLDGLGCAAGLLLGMAVSIGREMKSGVLLGEWELPPSYLVLGRVPSIKIYPTAEEPGEPHGTKIKVRKWRWALVSSAVLLMIVAAGVYFAVQKL
jgi:succinoglycan biosynthesis transport protein ExoP